MPVEPWNDEPLGFDAESVAMIFLTLLVELGLEGRRKVMDAALSNHSRPPSTLFAEGMWKIAVGESCLECWETLPKDQKEWWRSCATRAVGEWTRDARNSDHWGSRHLLGSRRFYALARRLLGRRA